MNIDLLEVTIRDGSYEIGFQNSLTDVHFLSKTFDDAKIKYIEIGHGGGLGAHKKSWRKPDDKAPYSDREYFEVCRNAAPNAKIGVPYFPHAEIDFREISVAKDCGLDFIRIIIHARELELKRNQDLIRYAKEELGLTVAVNLLKTYANPVDFVLSKSEIAIKSGADWIYVVDSAGCMYPKDVSEYVAALSSKLDTVVGFHGHNNLSLAVANSLAAIDAGAKIVDGSLQGMGRATGNAQTEILLSIMQNRYQSCLEVDRKKIYDAGRLINRFLLAGFDPIHVLSGVSGVHSSMLGAIEKMAIEVGVDYVDILESVGSTAREMNAVDSREMPKEVIDKVISGYKKVKRPRRATFGQMASIAVREEEEGQDPIIKKLKMLAKREKKKIALVAVDENLMDLSLPCVKCRGEWAIGFLPAKSFVDKIQEYNLKQAVWINKVYCEVSLSKDLPNSIDYEVVDLRSLISFGVLSLTRNEMVDVSVNDKTLLAKFKKMGIGAKESNNDVAKILVIQGKSRHDDDLSKYEKIVCAGGVNGQMLIDNLDKVTLVDLGGLIAGKILSEPKMSIEDRTEIVDSGYVFDKLNKIIEGKLRGSFDSNKTRTLSQILEQVTKSDM